MTYEQSVREKHELEKKIDELKLWTSGGGENSINGTGELQSLRNEFAQYRKRALLAVEQKEKKLSEMQYHENGGGSSTTSRSNSFQDTLGRRMSAESNTSLSGFESLLATKTNEYLKNIVYKYMTSDKVEAKEHMEKAIATVLNFTPSELTSIQQQLALAVRCEIKTLHEWHAPEPHGMAHGIVSTFDALTMTTGTDAMGTISPWSPRRTADASRPPSIVSQRPSTTARDGVLLPPRWMNAPIAVSVLRNLERLRNDTIPQLRSIHLS
ncbi:hypothetical protein PsorP6_010062 [Peronosclerospora sorghi]|uniref:Uncharacterized protein n=1 Tax=Peronosclerospora sorghi TaxID=230839 RepID=A0ACC0VUC2_9STRA|nr:hypothetical protein PsorP6_010062 [Peronosclerospora sorghi]